MGRARRRHLNRASRARLAASLATRQAADSIGGVARSGWPADPTERAVLERLNTLTLKQRHFVIRFFETGNARRSVIDAGYRCKNLRTADDISRELRSTPVEQHALQAVLESRGLGKAKLNEILPARPGGEGRRASARGASGPRRRPAAPGQPSRRSANARSSATAAARPAATVASVVS